MECLKINVDTTAERQRQKKYPSPFSLSLSLALSEYFKQFLGCTSEIMYIFYAKCHLKVTSSSAADGL